MNIKILIGLGLCIASAIATEETLPTAITFAGKVRGTHKTSTDGRIFSAFEGIPYAKPPVGDLRFVAPQPIPRWRGTWQANSLVTCMQSGFPDGKTVGTEDCLYLNIYVPGNDTDQYANLDVIVHIHGGAYMSGSGHELCGPEHLMDRDVVYVTINYRLNIFGFLSLADDVLPGNNGLKDQSMALRWIKQNIGSFGGNPESVTITGLSAGGSSVHYHYFSPLSKGLFHRGFSESGTALNTWALQDKPVEQAKKLAALAGCPDTDSQVIVNCLRQRNAHFLIDQIKEFTLIDGLPVGGIAPFAPSIESGLKGAFLPEHPFYTLTQNKVLDVPWISSITADEGLIFAAFALPILSVINEKWDQVAPYICDYNFTSAASTWPQMARSIKEHYFGDEEISLESIDKYVSMLSERHFNIAAEVSAKAQSKANKSPVYFYIFNYETDLSLTSLIPNCPLKGKSHGDDSFYLYNAGVLSGFDLKYTPKDVELRNQFLDMLTSFAKTGVPSFNGVAWEPTTGSELHYLEINGPTDMKMVTKKQISHRDFWMDLGILENENIVIHSKDEL